MKRIVVTAKAQNPPKHPHIPLQFFGSNMRCKICKGWGGEYGDARGVGPMCSDCYYKKYGAYD